MENVMFKKIPYGVKVRVRGTEHDGFIAEYALHCARFLHFLDEWNLINYYPHLRTRRPHAPVKKQDTFPTFELAKEAAMTEYDGWIDFYKRAEETKRVAKLQRKVVWKHP